MIGYKPTLDEDIDHANRIVLADPVFQAFRKQRGRTAIDPLNDPILPQIERESYRGNQSRRCVFRQAGSFSTDRRYLRDVRCSSDIYRIAGLWRPTFRANSGIGKSSIPLSEFRAFFLKLDLAIVLISLMCIASPTAAPRQASVAESPVALPPVSVESRHAVSHALNPPHQMPAASTGQHAAPNMPLLWRHHAARPDDPQTWSASGTVHLRLPFLRTGRNKGSS